MQGYIGPLGNLQPFMKFRGALQVNQESRSNFETTLGGFVSEQRGPRRKRAWVGTIEGSTYRENAQFKALADGFYGEPPFYLALPYQQVTNMFTPAQSIMEAGTWSGTGVVAGGGIMLPDGLYAGRSVLHPTGGVVDFGLTGGVRDTPPLLPGQPIAWSAYVRGAGNIQLQWLDVFGAIISTTSSAYNTPAIDRVIQRITPPAGAVRARHFISGVLQATCPAMTWTEEALEWVPGNGCNSVTVDSLPETPIDTFETLDGSRDSEITFRITEVG